MRTHSLKVRLWSSVSLVYAFPKGLIHSMTLALHLIPKFITNHNCLSWALVLNFLWPVRHFHLISCTSLHVWHWIHMYETAPLLTSLSLFIVLPVAHAQNSAFILIPWSSLGPSSNQAAISSILSNNVSCSCLFPSLLPLCSFISLSTHIGLLGSLINLTASIVAMLPDFPIYPARPLQIHLPKTLVLIGFVCTCLAWHLKASGYHGPSWALSTWSLALASVGCSLLGSLHMYSSSWSLGMSLPLLPSLKLCSN